jgi:hypothetical protein
MDWSSRLHDLLDEIEPLGTFATAGRLNPLNPTIAVEGVGTLGFPLMSYCLEPFKSVATQVPQGQGNETHIEVDARWAWQIEASKVSFDQGTLWSDYLAGAVRQACRELGLSDKRFNESCIHATLNTMLVYETGGCFAPHHDAEKEDGTFGTLIIQLPSAFTGCPMTFEHTNETKTFDLSVESGNSFQYVAFYDDCKHILHQVESGVLLTLVYALVASPKKELPSYAFQLEPMHKLRSLASAWKAQVGAPDHLGYQLAHNYSPEGFSVDSLKGHDAVVLNQLMNTKMPNGDPMFHI